MAAIGGTNWTRSFVGLAPNGRTPDASSEAIFATLTREREVPRRLLEVMATIPSDRPLLVLQPRENLTTSLPSMMLAYALSHRPVVIREAALTDTPAAVEELRKVFGAVIFVGQNPPSSFPPAQHFGAAIALVPLTTAAP